MISQYDNAVQEIIPLFRATTFFRQQCCLISVTAIVTYDGIVTLSREASLFWTGEARLLSAVLYFSNKYLNILAYIIGILLMAAVSDKSCSRITTVFRLMTYLSSIPPAVFTALRADALTQRLWLSVLVFLLLISQFIGNMVGLIWFRGFSIHSPAWGCIDNIAIPHTLGEIGIIGTRVSTILSDIMLVVITWKFVDTSSIMNHKVRSSTTKMHHIASIMLHNAIIYFIVLSVLSILQLIFTIEFPGEPDGLGVLNFISYFATPLSSVLVSHFLLDLQEAHQRTVVGLATDDSFYTLQNHGAHSLDFANMLGSLGATIYSINDEDEERTDGCLAVSELESISPSNAYGSSRNTQAGDEFIATEVLREGLIEAAFGA